MSDSFEAGAAIVRERSAGLCEAGRPGCRRVGSQTHHRLPRGMGGVSRSGMFVNTPANLVRICLPCHNWAESHREDAVELGLLVRRGDDPASVPVWLRSVHGLGWYLLTTEGDLQWQDIPSPPETDPFAFARDGAVGKKSSGAGNYPLL